MTNPHIHQEVTKPKLLIGEGIDELRFFRALVKFLDLTNIQIEQYGGKDKLSKYLRGLSKRPGYQGLESLGIFRDADKNAKSAFQSVEYYLKATQLPSPSKSGQFAEGKPRVGVFILPDGINPGMLEDVCLASVQSSPEMTCVDQYFHCLRTITQKQPRHLSKARVHAWLSSQIEPDKRLAEAAEAGYWPWESKAFDLIKQFLRGL
jgi:hypothetical protein